ncbi:MAG: 1-deoxy-D-xylulose-5-phosphate synthase [Chloroflexi bacterium]|nr:1-deoxy-D-xylulose-5-phosphate synthase [Chloroflexota bacterium]
MSSRASSSGLAARGRVRTASTNVWDTSRRSGVTSSRSDSSDRGGAGAEAPARPYTFVRPREGKLFVTLLETIREPTQLHGMTKEQLETLASELREKMIRTVHSTGGHLASSLGAVELTLALHRVMDSPRDRIVWDTGHQAYAHKLLSGRSDRFDTLRQLGGIGGFPRRSESDHDVFDGGHAGTGVSIGVGLAAARDLRPRSDPASRQRIAVCVGDAAVGSGLTMEALNHLGHTRHPLLIVLNDNEMSISPSVGGLSTRLNKMRLSRAYQETKSVTQRTLPKIPVVGRPAFQLLAWAKEGFKRSWAKVGFFEDIGITYIGVLDGHDLSELEEAFEAAFQLDGPVLVHVKTIKGRGYAPAEEDSMSFHGASLPPIDLCLIDPTEEPLPAEGKPTRKPKTYTQTFVEELVRLGEDDPRIQAITAGMPTGTGLSRFAEHFPTRFHDVGIAEQHAVTMAAGMALGGLKPVVALYSTFGQRAYDGLVHDVCQNDLPVVLGLDRSGLVGEDGTSHQGMFMLPAMRSLPNLVIGSPKDEQELRDLVVTAHAHPGPMALLYPRDAGEDLADRQGEPIEIGRGELLRSGDDVLLVGFGPIVQRLLEVAAELEADGVSAAVINARWAKPLDEALIAEHAEGKRLVVPAEESAAMGGFGDGVLDALNRAGIHLPVAKIALTDGFVHHGAVTDLRAQQRIDAPGILAQVREALGQPAKPRSSKVPAA